MLTRSTPNTEAIRAASGPRTAAASSSDPVTELFRPTRTSFFSHLGANRPGVCGRAACRAAGALRRGGPTGADVTRPIEPRRPLTVDVFEYEIPEPGMPTV